MKKILFLVLIIIISLPAVFALFHPGFFQSDDGEWMIIRFSAFYQALADGQLPVRFLSRLNHEYGYPVANFLYPGFMYIGIPIKLLGFGFVDTIKIILGLSMVASALFTYLWLSKIFSQWSSFIGSIVYLYAPYHFFDLYKRGSVGEVLALALAPFILWQFERKNLFWSTIGVSMLVLSHNTLALLFMPIVVFYMVLKLYREREISKRVYQYTSIVVLGLGIATFFWMPAIYDLQYTVFFQTRVSQWQNHFADISLVGLTTLAIFVTFPILSCFDRSNHRSKVIAFFLFGVGIVGLFFSLSLSNSLWKFLPVSFVQFPFRLLSLTLLSTAFLVAFSLSKLKDKQKIIVGAIIAMVSFYSSLPFMSPKEFFNKGEGLYATNMGTTTVSNEYMPQWVKNIPVSRLEKKVEVEDGTAEHVQVNSNRIAFSAHAINDTKVIINTIYFPGWGIKVNNKQVPISYTNDKGVISIHIPSGESVIEAVFRETPIRLISDFISIGSFALLVILSFIIKKNIL